jgi:hypothetical protein
MLVMPANAPDAVPSESDTPQPVDTQPVDTQPVDTQPVSADAAKSEVGAPDDVRERFRAALEHKRTGGPGADGAHGGGKTGTATTNSKVQRTFRRRAGG